jgi:hypothetical protein
MKETLLSWSARLVPWQVKVLPLETPRQRVEYWTSINRQREAWVKRMRPMVTRRFEEEKTAVLAAMHQGGMPRLEPVLHDQIPAWRELYRTLYVNVGLDVARHMTHALKSVNLFSMKAPPVAAGTWEQAIQAYVDTIAGLRITDLVEDTTLSKLQQVLTDGIFNGESMVQIADRIGDLYDDWMGARALTIARTEVLSAANFASRAAAKETGLTLEREWISTQDHRTRDGINSKFDHLGMDGKRVAMDEPWTVSGEKMMFPGDSSLGASAGNQISCRCCEGFHRVDE